MSKFSAKEYSEAFDEFMATTNKIKERKGKRTIYFSDEECWMQCYKSKDKVRKLLPKYWFVSDKGNLISMYYIDKPRLLRKDNDDGRYSYHFILEDKEGKKSKKNIEAHNLVWIVFGGESFGKAGELYKEQGLYAFGVKDSSELKINGHHEGKKEDNSPDNIEVITTVAHKVIDSTPTIDKLNNQKKMNKFFSDFGSMAADENPKAFTLLLTGQKYDKEKKEFVSDDGYRELKSLDKLVFSKDAMQTILEIQKKAISKWIIEKVVEEILQEYGRKFFEEPRFFATNYLFYKCYITENSLTIEEIDTQELTDKALIGCYLNSDKNIMYCIN